MPGSRQRSIEIRTRSTHPATPPSGYVYVYRLSPDGAILYKDSSDNVRELTNFSLESLVAALSGQVDSISGTYVNSAYVASLSGYLQSEIDSIQTQINNLDSIYATDAAVASISAYLQSEIDLINTGTVTPAYIASITAFLQSEIDSNQTSLNNLDLTYATDAAVASTSAYLQAQITNLDNTYATDAAVAATSASITVYLPSVVGRVALNTSDSAYTVTNSHIRTTSMPQLTIVPPVNGETLYTVAATNMTTGSFVIEVSDIPAIAGYYVDYMIYDAAFGMDPIYAYATWDTSFVTGRTYSNGNLTVAHANNGSPARSTIGVSTGKWVFSIFMTSGADNIFGMVETTWPMDSYPGVAAYTKAFGWNPSNNELFESGSSINPGVTLSNGDEVTIYVDMDLGQYRVYKNGTAITGSDRNLPQWVSGQTWYAAASTVGGAASNTLNAGSGPTANMTTIANARGANIGLFTVSY